MCRALSILLAGSLLAAIAISAHRCAADDVAKSDSTLPRYRLEVGQEITYESASEFNYAGGSFDTKTEWRISVVAKNDDGGWRLLLQSIDKSPGRGSGRAQFAYCDLSPDGRFAPNATLGFHVDPNDVIVSLPQNEGELKNGWSVENPSTDVTISYRVVSEAGANPIEIEVEKKSPMDEIYLSTSKSTVYFDATRGLIERSESENTQGFGFDGKGTGHTEFVSAEMKGEEWAKTLREDSDRYFATDQKYDDLIDQAMREPERMQTLLDEAAALLSSAREQTSAEIIREQLDNQINNHASMADYAKRTAEERAQLVGKPAPEWETTDFEGKAHSLEGLRGKVVILDFWYRGCGWCIRAMPQVNEVADAFKDKDVVVCGMNIDRKDEDAQFVIDKMQLNYPNLKATGIPEKYQVRAYPTLIIIDQEGNIHDIHVGYSPTLREEVSATVAQLLSSKQ